MKKVRTTITIDLAILKGNESLVDILLGQSSLKEILEASLLKTIKEKIVYKGFDLEHDLKIEVIDE